MGITVGMVGTGAFAQCFIPLFQAHPLVDEVILCDLDTDKLQWNCNKYGIHKTSPSLDHLCKTDVDAVAIITQNWMHAPQAVQALRAGKHVVIEAPMCMTIRDADAIAATARQYRRIVSVFHSHLWDADYVALHKVTRDGKLGAVFAVERRAYLAADSWATSAAGNSKQPSWRLKREYGGGIGYDFGYHLVDQVLRLVPSEPEIIFGDAQARELTTEVDDHFMCAIRFRNRAMAVVETSACVRTPGASWLVVGTKGSIQGDDKKLKGKTGSGARQKDLPLRTVKPDAFDFYANLHKALTAGGELDVTTAEARQVVLVLEAAYRSSRVGCAVRLTGFE